jgi:uncharacterized membrane protein
MSTEPTTPKRTETITGLLWGVFAILAAVGTFESPLAVRIICWVLALGIAFALVRLGRRSASPVDATSGSDRTARVHHG